MKLTTSKYYIPSGRCVQAIDYKHRNEDGSVGRIPDSLTTVFHTAAGREVRDGGGVTPDITVKQDKLPNILFYLVNDNLAMVRHVPCGGTASTMPWYNVYHTVV